MYAIRSYYDVRDPLHTHDGKFEVEDVRVAGFGGRVTSHLGIKYLVLRPRITSYNVCYTKLLRMSPPRTVCMPISSLVRSPHMPSR